MFANLLHQEAQVTPPQSGTIAAQPERIEPHRTERSISRTSPGRLQHLWHQLRLAVQEMNYASRRMVELQARPGSADAAVTRGRI